MIALSLSRGSRVAYRGETYVVTRPVDLETVLAEHAESGQVERLPIRELRLVGGASAEETKEVDLAALPDEDLAEAERRYQLIRPLLEDRHRTAAAVKEVAAAADVHWTTIYAWIRAFEAVGRLSALLPPKPPGGHGKTRLDPEVEKVLQETIQDTYLTKQKRSVSQTIKEVNRRLANAGLPKPHPNTTRNRIAVLTAQERINRRWGAAAARQEYELIKGAFPGAEVPLAVAQVDHMQLDIEVVDDEERHGIGRPWLTLVIDVFSRMVLGFYVSLDPPGNTGTGLAIAHSALPKDAWLAKRGIAANWPCWGFARKYHADNAKEFRGNMLQLACKEHQSDIEWRPLKQPRYGAHVERLLGTIAREIHGLPGTTFSNPAARGDYNSAAQATMTLAALEVWLATWICKVYHIRVHSGLGTSPLRRYEEGIFGDGERPGIGLPPVETDPDRVLLDFMPFVQRTVQRYGVQIDNIEYSSDILRHWVGAVDPEMPKYKRKFRFRRDYRDLSIIYFYDPEAEAYYRVGYRNTSRPPVSIWEWREARRRVEEKGGEVDEESIFAAYNELREIEEREGLATRKARRDAQRRRDHRKADRPLSSSVAEPAAVADADDAETDEEEVLPFDETILIRERER
ncbi:MAG: TniA putative transposase [uncultured Gemmatimonadetes bacterium]|uniref:TniA putative transposase n=1 Tax=uncultured Gemmatimonadota bacterium TaxID=203437 RepID=A0A6J4KAE2_9BACT|nr:MAG: TniA putative transposase [uncultured Gemmatimonadota bacterium]